ncbi:MAG: putative cell wall binding protein [Acidimicrobiaceae bacterium]|nr:putative cell wall binding protein [Acidimicrobiaceae bacterium]
MPVARSRSARRPRVFVPAALGSAMLVGGIAWSTIPAGASSGTSGAHRGAEHHPVSGRSKDVLTTIFSGATLGVSQPDDEVAMDGHLFVVFQNGVGPQGQASSTGNLDSTVVELTAQGAVLGSWSLAGHADGLAADSAHDRLIATVNEDLNSSLFTIDPASTTAVQYSYSPTPLPHNGGTDAVSVIGDQIFISASAPGTTGAPAPQPSYPALYSVSLDASTHVATATPAFGDEASATVANDGSTQGTGAPLALTDPDSNEVVPPASPRFAGDLLLTSQGDLQQVYVAAPGRASQSLSVLKLSQSVNDTAWATSSQGTLYMTDNTNNLVDAFTGSFRPGTVFVSATPCSANSAPSTCPAPNYPANFLGTLDLHSGTVSPVDLGDDLVQPQGLVFVSSSHGRGERR